MTVLLGPCAVPPGRVLEVSGTVRADKSVQAVRGMRARAFAGLSSSCPRALAHPCHSHSLAPLRPALQSAITALSDNFDMDAYNDAVKVFPAFKMIF